MQNKLLLLTIMTYVKCNNYLRIFDNLADFPGCIRVAFYGAPDQWHRPENHRIGTAKALPSKKIISTHNRMFSNSSKIFYYTTIGVHREQGGISFSWLNMALNRQRVLERQNPLRIYPDIRYKSEKDRIPSYIFHFHEGRVYVYSGLEPVLFKIGIREVTWIRALFIGKFVRSSWIEPDNHLFCQIVPNGTMVSGYLTIEIDLNEDGTVLFKKFPLDTVEIIGRNPLVISPVIHLNTDLIKPFLYIFHSDGTNVYVSSTIEVATHWEPRSLPHAFIEIPVVTPPRVPSITDDLLISSKPRPEEVPYPSFIYYV